MYLTNLLVDIILYIFVSCVILINFCRDSRYVALKLYVANLNNTRELKAYECLDAADEKDHPGKTLIRKLLGSFQVDGHSSNGSSHLCLVHEPLGPSLEEILDLMPPYSFHLGFLKPVLRNILIAVDFLHARAGLIHTGTYFVSFLFSIYFGFLQRIFRQLCSLQNYFPQLTKVLYFSLRFFYTRPANHKFYL